MTLLLVFLIKWFATSFALVGICLCLQLMHRSGE